MPKPVTILAAIGSLLVGGMTAAAVWVVRTESFCPVHGGRLESGTAEVEYGRMDRSSWQGLIAKRSIRGATALLMAGVGSGRMAQGRCGTASAAARRRRGGWLSGTSG